MSGPSAISPTSQFVGIGWASAIDADPRQPIIAKAEILRSIAYFPLQFSAHLSSRSRLLYLSGTGRYVIDIGNFTQRAKQIPTSPLADSAASAYMRRTS